MPDTLTFIAALALGICVGGGFAFVRFSKKEKDLILENATLNAEKNSLTENNLRHQQELIRLEERFSLQFENLANKIFDEKTAKFKVESQEGLSQILSPLKEKLQEFQKKVDDQFGQQAKEQFSLKNEIANIVAVNQKMTLQTESLTRALKGDVKAQGNWGEVVLEKILDMAGLRRDIDYIVQGADLNLKHVEDGSHLKPDVVVMLPEEKHIIIDSKVSLTAYERYCATEDDTAKALHLKEYIASIKAHVQGLTQRRYTDAEKLGTPDFVLMFMPIEGAYSLAMQQDPELHSYAWDKKIAIVCPSTLFISLRTIASLWRIERQNKNALEIARQGGNLYDKVVSFVEDMQDIGRKIEATQKSYDGAFKKLSTGTGNIIKRTEDLKELGIKAEKKMPAGMVDEPSTLKIAENG